MALSAANREAIIVKTSVIGIAANMVLSIFKGIAGIISGSISITLDAVNNLSDALSSIITIIGTKLANQKPDKNHPYGHGRIEFLTAIIISLLILYAGISSLIESIKKIIHPTNAEYSMISILIMVAAIAVKLWLGEYFKKKGELVRSTSLVASGADASFDAFLTFSVLVSVLLNMIFNIRIEAYIGLMISVFIIKAGYELISDQTSELLGRRPDAKLSQTIKKVVNSDPDVLGAYDLTLHNYGPNRLIGSIHVTVNDTMMAKDIDRMTRRIQKTVMEQTGVFLTAVSIYSRNTMDDTVTKMTKQINQILSKKDYILQMHGLYIDHEKKSIHFDVVIDFDCPDPQALHREIVEEVQQTFPDYNVQIVIDNDFSE